MQLGGTCKRKTKTICSKKINKKHSFSSAAANFHFRLNYSDSGAIQCPMRLQYKFHSENVKMPAQDTQNHTFFPSIYLIFVLQ